MTGLPAAVDLRVEGRVDPIGLDEPRPRLTWRVELAPDAVRQRGFAIEVARDPSFRRATRVWTATDDSTGEAAVRYAGPPVGSRAARFWRVRLTDDLGIVGAWSRRASWEMGLLTPDDWAARWIAWIDPARPSWSSRSPILRRSFRLVRGARRARAYVTALGLVELTINGHRVGEDLLAPGWTDYRRRVQYRTTDILEHLRVGENVVAARLGRGWYAGEVAAFGAEQYGDYPALMAQLEIELEEGGRVVVASDAAWRAHPGPLVADDLLLGESFDARDEPAGWREPGDSDDDWQPVILAAGPGGELVAQRDDGVRVVEALKPVAITRRDAGRHIVDFGQNIAGHVRIRAAAPAGTTVTLRHAEVLDETGELYTANLRSARQTDAYTFRGGGPDVVEPRFTTHGFRYAEIAGLTSDLDPTEVTAVAISSMGRATGSFACSDELVNRIHRNVEWGLRGGIVAIPTDCPQRDERLGWAADAAAMAPSALFLGDTAPVFEAWLIDLADAQLPSGAYPDVAPRIGVTGAGNAGWADAGVLVPWEVYQQTGNPGVIERQYDSMQRYLGFLASDHVDGVRHGGRYGDWLALEEPTSLELIGTAYLAHSAAVFGRMAALIDRREDARAAERLARRATTAFRRRFLASAGTLRHETQTGYGLALGFGLLPRAERTVAAGRLARLIEAAGGHLLTGFLGTPLVLGALSDHGHHALATAVIRQDTYPGLGFEVRQGATTVWERWDSWTPERGFADPEMNSFNHAALGSVAGWMHRDLAGLAPAAPGYSTVLVRPRPAPGIDWAQASHESAHGRHAVEWRSTAAHLRVIVDVPPNTFTDVVLPEGTRRVWVDGERGVPGRRRHRVSWGRHVLEAEG